MMFLVDQLQVSFNFFQTLRANFKIKEKWIWNVKYLLHYGLHFDKFIQQIIELIYGNVDKLS